MIQDNHRYLIAAVMGLVFVIAAVSCAEESTDDPENNTPDAKNFCKPGDPCSKETCPPPEPHGYDQGQKLANLMFKNVEGDTVELHDLCGDVSVVFHFYGWDPLSKTFANKANDIYDTYKGHGFNMWLVIGEDDQQKAPSQAFCYDIKEQYDLNFDVVCDSSQQFKVYGTNSLVVVTDETALIIYKKAGATFNTVQYAVEKELFD